MWTGLPELLGTPLHLGPYVTSLRFANTSFPSSPLPLSLFCFVPLFSFLGYVLLLYSPLIPPLMHPGSFPSVYLSYFSSVLLLFFSSPASLLSLFSPSVISHCLYSSLTPLSSHPSPSLFPLFFPSYLHSYLLFPFLPLSSLFPLIFCVFLLRFPLAFDLSLSYFLFPILFLLDRMNFPHSFFFTLSFCSSPLSVSSFQQPLFPR